MKKQAVSLWSVLFLLCSVLSGCGANKKTGEVRNVYLAGPFFNDTEIANIEYAERILTEKGLSFFSPMRHSVDAEAGTAEWSRQIFDMDVEELEKTDAVLLMYYGNYSDSGTAWECGYAYAVGKPIVVVHADREADSNLMVHQGCTTNIYLDELADFDFDEMPVYVYEGEML